MEGPITQSNINKSIKPFNCDNNCVTICSYIFPELCNYERRGGGDQLLLGVQRSIPWKTNDEEGMGDGDHQSYELN